MDIDKEFAMRDSQVRFIRQQGITTPSPDRHLYEALMLQPRIIGRLHSVAEPVAFPDSFSGALVLS
jgi:hypothetical protein